MLALIAFFDFGALSRVFARLIEKITF